MGLQGWSNTLAPCIHEAGHAVVAEALGMRIVHMQVSEDGSGVTTPSPHGSEHLIGEAGAHREAQIALAGTAAETRYCNMVGYPDEPGYHPVHGRHGDRERTWRAVRECCEGDDGRASRLLSELRVVVDELVARNFDVITILAIALEAAGEDGLSGNVLAEMLQSASA